MLKRYWMVATGMGCLPKGKKTGEIEAYSEYDAILRLTRGQCIRVDQLWLVAFEERKSRDAQAEKEPQSSGPLTAPPGPPGGAE